MIRQKLIPLVFTFWLSACGAFFPEFSDTARASFDQGMKGYSEILAATELGDYQQASTYSVAAPKYAATLGAFRTARIEVENAPSRGLADDAKAKVLEQVDNCITGITTLAAIHKSAGLAGGIANYQTGLTVCAIASESLN